MFGSTHPPTPVTFCHVSVGPTPVTFRWDPPTIQRDVFIQWPLMHLFQEGGLNPLTSP